MYIDIVLRSSVVWKMSIRKDLLALGAAVASAAVAGYVAITYEKQKINSKSTPRNGSENVLKDENTTNGKKDLQAGSLSDKDKLKMDREEEEFKAFALFWNSWK